MGKITFRRQRAVDEPLGSATAMNVFVDDEFWASIPSGMQKKQTIANGMHRISVEMDGFRSKAVEFLVSDDVDLIIDCVMPMRGPLRTLALLRPSQFFKLHIAFTRKN